MVKGDVFLTQEGAFGFPSKRENINILKKDFLPLKSLRNQYCYCPFRHHHYHYVINFNPVSKKINIIKGGSNMTGTICV